MKSRLLKSLLFLMATSTVLNSFAKDIVIKETNGRNIQLDLELSTTATDLYRRCSEEFSTPIDQIKLISGGKEIPNNDDSTISDILPRPVDYLISIVFLKPTEKRADSSVKIVAGRKSISVNYTPGKTTNHDMYLKAAALERPGSKIASLETLATSPGGAGLGAIEIKNDDNVFSINPENDKFYANLIYANLIRTTSLPTRVDDSSPAGAGSGSSADLRAETALEEAVAIEAPEEAVAIEALEEVLSDIETVDLNNLAHVEAKLQQLGATYNGLTTIDLDEKQAILRRILEYKKIKAFKAIHTLLKHNQFKI